ncbi:hypothetical protein GCM10009627_32530 [Curtobacterium herbarum]|uniref:Uncharacterized protein n=1 Tax=Curtobacterium herbarum TaxID=150122 RepID=A0ABP4K749_9MICO
MTLMRVILAVRTAADQGQRHTRLAALARRAGDHHVNTTGPLRDTACVPRARGLPSPS